MKISVIIPTYRRVADLTVCLNALAAQQRLPDEVLVVVQAADLETWEFSKSVRVNLRGLKWVSLEGQGQVAGLNRGLEEARGDILCFTDDDAEPHKQWLSKIEEFFIKDPKLGGLGGRDYMYVNGRLIDGRSDKVGIISWYGRIWGNHHLGYGEPRKVDHLKGVNMSYRREAVQGLRFDTVLRGRAEFRNDFSFSLSVRNRGWHLFYDPAICLDHHISRRAEDTQRGQFDPKTVENESFNEFYAILKYFPAHLKLQGIIWSLLAGNIAIPGIFQIFRKLPYSREEVWGRMKASYSGKSLAFTQII